MRDPRKLTIKTWIPGQARDDISGMEWNEQEKQKKTVIETVF
jgi:hypothetical protein